jgi:predicted DNA binding CopG/RHH family protein
MERVKGREEAVPAFASEAEERAHWETHDSSAAVDWGKARRVRLPRLKPSTVSISLRMPVGVLERIKVEANRRDVPYQSLIKMWLAEKVG